MSANPTANGFCCWLTGACVLHSSYRGLLRYVNDFSSLSQITVELYRFDKPVESINVHTHADTSVAFCMFLLHSAYQKQKIWRAVQMIWCNFKFLLLVILPEKPTTGYSHVLPPHFNSTPSYKTKHCATG